MAALARVTLATAVVFAFSLVPRARCMRKLHDSNLDSSSRLGASMTKQENPGKHRKGNGKHNPDNSRLKRQPKTKPPTLRKEYGLSSAYKGETMHYKLHSEIVVPPSDPTYSHLAHWLTKGDGDVTVQKITSIDNPGLMAQYEGARTLALWQLGRQNMDSCYVETWLWHATTEAVVSEILETGWNNAFASMKRNWYGAGSYFAPDARLAHFFSPNHRNEMGVKKLILARAVTGRSCSKHQVCTSLCSEGQWKDALTSPKNRFAPPGFHSVTNFPVMKYGANTEVIIYENTRVYPAYVFEFTAPEWSKLNPYINRNGLSTIADIDNLTPFGACNSNQGKPLPGGQNTGNTCPI